MLHPRRPNCDYVNTDIACHGDRPRCHELRIPDEHISWRIVHRLDPDAVIITEVFHKTTRSTPRHVIEICRRRLRLYDAHANPAREGQ